MNRKKVFVSFDYDNDRHYKFLLEAWAANPQFDFGFKDETPREIDTSNIGRIKAGLTTKINDATHTLVLVGKEIDKYHKNRVLIGFRNWQVFEIQRSKENRNAIVAVQLERSRVIPVEELRGSDISWVWRFDEKEIVSALNRARLLGII